MRKMNSYTHQITKFDQTNINNIKEKYSREKNIYFSCLD